MTIERDSPTGTARYVPPRFTPGADVFGLASPATPLSTQPGVGPALFEWLPATRDRSTVGWRVTIYDLRMGLNRTRGNFYSTHGATKKGDFDTRYAEHAVLPQLVEDGATEIDTANGAMFGVNVFGTLAMITSSRVTASDPTIWKETSATNPAPTPLAYDPGADRGPSTAESLLLGGSSTQRLVVAYSGGTPAGAKVFSDVAATPTLAGTMHADTDSATGFIQTFANDKLILIKLASSIATLASSVALTTQPTTALSNLPYGGWPIGLLSLAGGPVRAYWVWGRNGGYTVASTALGFTRTAQFAIFHTNIQGTDAQMLPISELAFIKAADKIRDGIVATDGKSVVFHNGVNVDKLRWNTDRAPDSNREQSISAIYVQNDDLYVHVFEEATPSGTGNDKHWIERYDWDLRAWFPASAVEDLGGTSFWISPGGRSLPVSQATRFLHSAIGGASSAVWKRQYQPEPGVNPFSLRQTTGAETGTGRKFAASGYWESPTWRFPAPIEYAPKVVDRIICGSDLDAGGTGAQLTVAAGGMSWDFKQPLNSRSRWHEFSANQHRFMDLDVRMSGNRNESNVYLTPQFLPITIEGRAFLDELKAGPHQNW